jgi:hypothetical protein
MMAVGDTLLLFGGKMGNGNLSNQLWQYNVSGTVEQERISFYFLPNFGWKPRNSIHCA